MTIDIQKRLAGIMVPVFALRSKEDLGIGDTLAVRDAIDFCHSNNFGVLQLLPISETGADNSPYNAITAMALDPAYISLSSQALDTVPGLLTDDLINLNINTSDVIDYPQVKALKQSLLETAFARYDTGKVKNFISLNNEFKIFQDKNKDWLPDYVLFRTIVKLNNGNAMWDQWESQFRDAQTAKKWIEKREQKEAKKISLFFAYVQWVAHRQWTIVKEYADKKLVKLIGDIPFGVSLYSADVWANTNLFDLDWSGGAPPERFFKADKFTAEWGQNWGIPLYDWSAHEKQAYRWWHSRIQQVTKYFHGYRLDHVLGFYRIYAFPWRPQENDKFVDLTPEGGKLITGGRIPGFKPRDDESKESAILNCQEGEARLKAILKVSPEAIVIAEDLGMVPPYVRPSLIRLGIPGFSIPLFERDEIDRSYIPANELPALNLATYGTHDHEPIANYYDNLVDWWHSDDGHNGWLEVQRLMRFLHLDENHPPAKFNNDLACTFFKVLFSTPCWLAVLMITDLLGGKQKFNSPGTSNASNWSERLGKPLTEYALEGAYSGNINCAKQEIIESNRQPRHFAHTALCQVAATK